MFVFSKKIVFSKNIIIQARVC